MIKRKQAIQKAYTVLHQMFGEALMSGDEPSLEDARLVLGDEKLRQVLLMLQEREQINASNQ